MSTPRIELAFVHVVEEFVSIQDVDTGLSFGIPAFQVELVGRPPRADSERLAQKVVDQSCHRLSLVRRQRLEAPEKVVFDRQRGAPHSKK